MTTRREFLVKTAAPVALAAASTQISVAGTGKSGGSTRARMKTYTIARTDLVVSRLAFGCAMLGFDGDGLNSFTGRMKELVRTAYEQGVTFFDLADVYGGGRSEEALGEVLKQSPGMRHEIVIQSKCGDRLQWGNGRLQGGCVDNSQEHITSSVEGSLQRLGTDHLDLLLLHWPDSLVRPEEVARAFDALKRSGKVRYFGVSNHNPMQYELLQKYVHQPLVTNQIQLGLMHWDSIPNGFKAPLVHGGEGATTVDYCRVHSVWVQAYSPLKGDDFGNPPNLLNPPADAAPEIKRSAELLADVARRYDATPAAIMLAWLLRHPAGITPIIGATKVEHIVQSCEADRVDLSRDEWYTILAAASRTRQPGLS